MRTDMSNGVALPPGVAGTEPAATTLVDLCRSRATAEPDRRGFVFLADGSAESDALTLGELDRRARAIAVTLFRLAPVGSRALLSYPPGLDFHAAFCGCLYAGMIPVPVAAMDGTRRSLAWTRLESIAASARPELFLSTGGALDRLEAVLDETPELRRLTRVATDDADPAAAERWNPPPVAPDGVAYLQYSSGSTGAPKGVALTHTNVLQNLALLHHNFARRGDEEGVPRPPSVIWLPVHYNMGLVGGLLEPLFSGREVTSMPPAVFVQRPYSWLRAISDLGRADSCAPTFAYELCVRRLTEVQRARLDLSRWEVALVGGEPVRAGVLERFWQTFAMSGFQRTALMPAYGLAESTVMVSGGPAGLGPVVLRTSAAALTEGRVRIAEPGEASRELVSSGQIHPSQTVVAVDTATGKPCDEDEVGEIFVSAPGVGHGYWNAPRQTAGTFSAHLPDYPGLRFLRTGDLGFLRAGQLFITGRAKDVVIIAGANHYPHDIEATVEASHPAVREFGCCAFSVDDGERERLVVLAELVPAAAPVHGGVGATATGTEDSGGTRDLERAIRRAVNAEHGLQVHDVVLLAAGSLPFTSNGKLQRRQCVDRYLSGDLHRAGTT